MSYATKTSVSAATTRTEIEKMLRDQGATGIGFIWDDDSGRQCITFKMPTDMSTLVCRMECPMPRLLDPEISHTPAGKRRTPIQAETAIDQVNRSRWRLLKIKILGKLNWVEIGGATFEEEFLPHVVMSSGRTLTEEVLPQLPAAIEGTSRLLLPPGK